MSCIKDVIKNRRSIRKFEDRDVSDEQLVEILESSRWAPSWANTQCWEIVVIRDKQQKEKLAEILSPKNPATLVVKNAPVVLVLGAKLQKSGFYKGEPITKFHDWFMYDLGIVTQNICLTVSDLGLGSVIVGAFDHDRARQLLKIPEGYEVVSKYLLVIRRIILRRHEEKN